MFSLRSITAIAALASTVVGSALQEKCPSSDVDIKAFAKSLSHTAEVYYPGSSGFENVTARWSVLEEPQVNLVVVPGTENDVAETVKYANKKNIPFLAYNGVHGALVSLGKMDHGIGISLSKLRSIKVNEDGKTATFGGGVMSKQITDHLWAAGKQTVTGTCECVSYLGPALGGGHGWLQGHHGLVADQFVSMNVVLADGTLTTIDADSELWWAMKGAGHNFGIVTSVTSKIYDIEHTEWAIETITFSGAKVEAVYQAANDYLVKNGTQPAGVINWSYWMNDGSDPNSPVIVFYIIQEGVKAVESTYTKAFHEIGPISVNPQSGTYKELAIDSPPCQKLGFANPRFPIYLEQYNVHAQKKAWDIYAPAGYSAEGVHAIPTDSTAFAFRSENLLAAPMINYAPAGDTLERKAADLGNQLRNILSAATGRDDFRAYINYAYGSETSQQIYGSENWRQERLSGLKHKYDPRGKFSFYAPIE
ncbi:unnamed protein product [Penicillium salamii]|nr:unnamed protein product [Penicillium salamii]CAG8277577.1 unnamed protein product [Penicillium salamii]